MQLNRKQLAQLFVAVAALVRRAICASYFQVVQRGLKEEEEEKKNKYRTTCRDTEYNLLIGNTDEGKGRRKFHLSTGSLTICSMKVKSATTCKQSRRDFGNR